MKTTVFSCFVLIAFFGNTQVKVIENPNAPEEEAIIEEPRYPLDVYESPYTYVEDSMKVYDYPAELAEFPGGTDSLIAYLNNNVRYPSGEDVQGRVYIEFIVERDGSISTIKILRGISKPFDDEAKRLVREMPHWKPAKDHGIVVRSVYRLPVRFQHE